MPETIVKWDGGFRRIIYHAPTHSYLFQHWPIKPDSKWTTFITVVGEQYEIMPAGIINRLLGS